MITGWGQHHFDSAAWGMNTEYTGPIRVEAIADFPKNGSWDVHGDFVGQSRIRKRNYHADQWGLPKWYSL